MKQYVGVSHILFSTMNFALSPEPTPSPHTPPLLHTTTSQSSSIDHKRRQIFIFFALTVSWLMVLFY